MKLLIQRVKSASVRVDKEIVGSINKGLLVFLGVGQSDEKEEVEKNVAKVLKLRIFQDDQGKTNLSVKDIGGQVLVVSQFTLYADCKKGNRPSFTKGGDPQKAEALYEYFKSLIKKDLGTVEAGVFGAHMDVELINDGPFTIIL